MTELKQQVQHALGDYYRLDDELTGGGMSRLFMATEVSLNRRVVVKVLPPEWASEVSAARFKREMEVAAQLQHPHILPVLAAGARTGLLYYIMPYVAGESLRARLKRDGALPIADAQRILAEIADALAFAHERGVIHRDIKPENILLEGRHAVLADFGVARALMEARTDTERLTSTGSSVGTPGYMSPEQVAGDQIDARADVYALSVVGYEMIAGKAPFTGPSAQAILRAHMSETPALLRTLRPDCPEAVERAIAKSLSKEPNQRFASSADFLQAVSGPGALSSRRRFAVPPRVIAIGAGAIAVVALIAAFVSSQRTSGAIVARVAAAADSGRLDEVARMLDTAGADVSDGRFSGIAIKVAGTLQLDSLPPGLTATATRVSPIAGFAQRRAIPLGRTPLTRSLVAGEYFLRLTGAGADTLERVVSVPRATNTVVAPSGGTASAGMVAVTSGPALRKGSVAAFEIGKYEVTNAEYQRFVDAGGYRDNAHWPDSMLVNKKWLDRAAALAQFADRSGLPGPRGWSGGKHPADQALQPVVSITWYEAIAYAQWSGTQLPTGPQWWRAALADGKDPFPWGTDGLTVEQRANFGLGGPAPVGSMRLGVSPFGAHDMAGNVREWLSDMVDARRRTVVGGSWQDPTYMFEADHAETFEPGYASPAIGFRVVRTKNAPK